MSLTEELIGKLRREFPDIAEKMDAAGVGTEEVASNAMQNLANLSTALGMAQNLYLVHIERCNDLGIPGHMALLSMYEVIRVQVLTNLRMEAITVDHLKMVRAGGELLKRDDPEIVPTEYDEAGNLKKP